MAATEPWSPVLVPRLCHCGQDTFSDTRLEEGFGGSGEMRPAYSTPGSLAPSPWSLHPRTILCPGLNWVLLPNAFLLGKALPS